MQRLKLALSCALLAALAGVAFQAILLLHAATRATRALPLALSAELHATRAALLTEVESTRQDLTAQIEGARKDLLAKTDGQVTALRTETLSTVSDLAAVADRRLGDTLARVDTALGTVDAFRADLRPTLTNAATISGHVSSITAHVDDALPAFTDCAYLDADGNPVGGNPDCAFNRFQGASKSFETAMRNVSLMSTDFRVALPKAIDVWQDFGVQTDAIAKNINTLTKPKWYDRLLGYGLNGVMIYRNMNPATNLTVKGAQFVASRP